MAVAIPIAGAIAGGMAGTAVAGAMALGTFGTAIAASIGSTLVSAAMSGGLDEMFDDPMQALVSIGVGAYMGYVGGNAFKDMPLEQQTIASGVSSRTASSGTIYDGMGNSIKSAINQMSDAGSLSYTSEMAKDIIKDKMTEPTFMASSGQAARDAITKVGDDLASRVMAMKVEYTDDTMLLHNGDGFVYDFDWKDKPKLPSSMPDYTKPFLYQDEDGFVYDMPSGEDLESGKWQKPNYDYELPKGGMQDPMPSYTPSRTSAVPGINQKKGSQGIGSGLAGLSQYDLYDNPVTRPMIEAYARQEQKMMQLAQKSWGLMQTSRTKGLMA